MAKNQLNEILQAAGRRANFTNRSFYCKAVNAALATGLIEIKIAPEGMVFTNKKTGKQYNLKVIIGNWQVTAMIKSSYIGPEDVLPKIGQLLLDEEVKKLINADVHLRATDCRKCQGLGMIPHFHYYCSGICFACGGTGRNLSNEKTTVKINNSNNQ